MITLLVQICIKPSMHVRCFYQRKNMHNCLTIMTIFDFAVSSTLLRIQTNEKIKKMFSNSPIEIRQQKMRSARLLGHVNHANVKLHFLKKVYFIWNCVEICGSQHLLTHKCHKIYPGGHRSS